MKPELVHAWVVSLTLSGILLAITFAFLFKSWKQKQERKTQRERPQPVDVLIISASSEDHHRDGDELSPATDDFCAVEQEGDPVDYKCGHSYAAKFAMNIYGQIMRPSAGYWEKRERCGDCEVNMFRELTRRCGCCGHVIMPDRKVSTYGITPSFRQKDGVEIINHQDGSRSVMGCLRMNCCPTGGLYYGTWTGSKVEPAFPSGDDPGFPQTVLALVVVHDGSPSGHESN